MTILRAGLLAAARLLERTHGVGVRGDNVPGWFEVRLTRALEALRAERSITLDTLVDQLEREPNVLAELAETLRVGETRFYRDSAQWDALRACASGRFGTHERVRGLSMGCSTGEEAWTLAMVLDSADLAYRVVGVDRSEVALSAARAAAYPSAAVRDLPSEFAAAYLERAEDDSLEVASQLRAYVSFVKRDLTQGVPAGHYEIIFCKNVLIYFGEQARREALTRLTRALAESGLLFVSRSEVPLVRALGYSAVELAPGVTAFHG